MKKKSIIVLVLFISALCISGQSQAQSTFGVKFGWNASKLSTDIASIKSSMNSGFHVGAFARVGNRVQLQPELYYTMSGATFNDLNDIKDFNTKITIGTLDIPVLLGFTVLKVEKFKWRIMVGPEASFLINSKIKDVSSDGLSSDVNIKKVNWYIQAGTGIDVFFLTFDIRYQTGLNSLVKDITGNSGTVYPVNTKGNFFVVSLGFKFK